MSDIKIVVGADVSQATTGLRAVQGELGKTAAISQASSNAFKSIGSSISGLSSSLISGGILTGIALLGTGLIELGKDMYSLTAAQKNLSEVLDGAKSAYVSATLQVEKMKVAFEQAKTGVITKEEALKLYNGTIGKTIGQTKDLDEAERLFTAQADNYIKFTLLKAAANIALGKAAEAAFKAEEERIKGATKEGRFLAELTASRFGSRSDEQRQQDRINKNLKEENQFKEIANSLQEKAKAFGFDYNAILEKDVKLQKEKTKEIKKQVDIMPTPDRNITGLNDLFDKTPIVKAPVIVQPEIHFLKTDQDKFFRDLQAFFDKEQLQAFQQEATAAIQQTFQNIIEDSISNITESVADAIVNNQPVLPALFSGLMRGIGQQIKELGKFLVKSGLEMKAAQKAIKALGLTPQTAIIAGIALQVLGALLVSAANKKASNVGQGFASGVRGLSQGGVYNVGERGPERIFLPAGSSVQPNNELNAYGGGQMVFIPAITLRGPDLVIAFNRAQQAMNRNN